MRLICPNCAAHYEIEPALIPKGGREVQCSSCGSTWFVAGKGAPAPQDAAEADPAPADSLASPPGPVERDRRASGEAAADPGEHADAARPATGAAEETGPREAPPERAAPHAPAETEEEETLPPRRELDPRTRAILLEEAERESASRRGGRTALEFGLKGAPPRSENTPPPRQGRASPEPRNEEHSPRPRAPVRPVPPPDAGLPSNPLLPDVEEINSTLTPRSRPRPAPQDPPKPSPQAKRSGFAPVFFAALLAALALAVLYVTAPAITRTVPALEPLLTGYVGAVNDLRETLAGL